MIKHTKRKVTPQEKAHDIERQEECRQETRKANILEEVRKIYSISIVRGISIICTMNQCIYGACIPSIHVRHSVQTLGSQKVLPVFLTFSAFPQYKKINMSMRRRV